MNYQPLKAVQYADLFWNKSNPNFIEFQVDCTNFISQCLYAGGQSMHYTGKRDSGWWYQGRHQNQELWSYSWTVAHSLQLYLLQSQRGTQVSHASQLQLGDVISYDWDGNGRFQHSAIVTAHDFQGMPLVNAHTYSARHKYWSYEDSPAWSLHTRYVFIHMI
jgi:hypothetical protein